jgi:hypothetical protein
VHSEICRRQRYWTCGLINREHGILNIKVSIESEFTKSIERFC